MEITEVKVFLVDEEKLKAFVSIVVDQCFMVNDIKVIQGRDGLFISMPSRKKKNGEFKDVAHPLNNETRRRIEMHILGEYRRVLDGDPQPSTGQSSAQRTDSRSTEPRHAVPRSTGPRSTGPQSTEPRVTEPSASTPADDAEQTLEEVEEKHLKDSFWSMP